MVAACPETSGESRREWYDNRSQSGQTCQKKLQNEKQKSPPRGIPSRQAF
jgi:hypothetical protein